MSVLRAPSLVEHTLRRVERAIVDSPVEIFVAVDRAGRVCVHRRGVAKSVALTATDLHDMRDTWVTHNHPRNFGPSETDVKLMYEHGAHQMRVVARSGDRIVRYVVAPKDPAAMAEYKALLKRTGKREGQFGPYQHDILRILASQGLIAYTRS